MPLELLDYYDIAEECNIDIHYLKLKTITAASVPEHILLNPDKIKTRLQLKDCLGHELGHCMTGSFYQIDNPLDLRERHEVRADRWRMKKEIPYIEYKKALKKGITELWELAEYFDVTEDFMRKTAEFYRSNPERTCNRKF